MSNLAMGFMLGEYITLAILFYFWGKPNIGLYWIGASILQFAVMRGMR